MECGKEIGSGVVALAAALAGFSGAAEAAPALVLQGMFPPDVRTIGIVAISSLLPKDQLVAGTNALVKAGYLVKVAPNVPRPEKASPEERARLLEEAWLDPEIDILWFARGGEGAAEVIPLLDWGRLSSFPDRRVIGFSDVTLLLNTMLAKNVGHPYSGPMLSALRYWNADSRDWFAAALRGGKLPEVKTRVLWPGKAESRRPDLRTSDADEPPALPNGVSGTPMGGHIERMHRLFEMGLLPSAQGRVVFLECTAKYPPDQVRKCLEDLRDGGALDGAAAVVFADFRHKGVDRVAIDAFLPGFAQTLPCPVFADYPYGHCPGSRMLDFRRTVSIAADGTVGWNEKP